MNEFQAAWGLLNLKQYREEQERRKVIKEIYDNGLKGVKGIRIPQMPETTTNSYQYYPIVIEDEYGKTRDEIYDMFKAENIFTRKYFYPACHDYDCYKNDITVKIARLRTTDDMKKRVLCLPFYGSLDNEVAEHICEVIRNVAK